jgi:hypothetical protein
MKHLERIYKLLSIICFILHLLNPFQTAAFDPSKVQIITVIDPSDNVILRDSSKKNSIRYII